MGRMMAVAFFVWSVWPEGREKTGTAREFFSFSLCIFRSGR
jgi:hypothetical protein